jgi:hypothetical protein
MEIELSKYYTRRETAVLLNMTTATLTEKCKNWSLKCGNIGTINRLILRIKWQSIVDFLNW